MDENHNNKYKIIKDFSGNPLILTLVIKEEYEDKLFDLYTVCKVIDDQFIPLYDETFTKEQYKVFYNKSTYYLAYTQEEE